MSGDLTEDWDFEAQKAETYLTVHQLTVEEAIPVRPGTPIALDLNFVPGADGAAPDQAAAVRALAMFGYAAEAEDDGPDAALAVTVQDVPFTADDIWLHEERVSRILLARGYEPDGWGFAEP